jgi:A/G-specific adenine glycosylase
LWEPVLTEDAALISQARLLRKDVKHILTHRILFADFYFFETDTPPTLPDEYIWVEESDLDQYALPRLIEILLKSLP